jgi:putative ATPase
MFLNLCQCITDEKIVITNKRVFEVVQQNTVLYDKTGEQHYDIVSAFIKSIRGSDPMELCIG